MADSNKREYDAPMVELIEARVEKGFRGSTILGQGTGDEITETGTGDNALFT